MQESAPQDLEGWKKALVRAWNRIPRAYRNDHSIRRTLQCSLFRLLDEKGFKVVADYMPPRIADRSIDIIALNKDMEIVYAVCLDTLVTLAAVKSLDSFAAQNKVIFTIGMLEKKVQESRFFLKPDIQHVHLRPEDKPL